MGTVTNPIYNEGTLNATTANVQIGTFNEPIGPYRGTKAAVTLSGSPLVTGTIGSLNLTPYNSTDNYNVTVSSGRWAITGPSNDQYPFFLTGGTLTIAGDSSLGIPPSSASNASTALGNVVFQGGTLVANSTFTLNQNRVLVLGNTNSTNYNANVGVAAGQTLTFNGPIQPMVEQRHLRPGHGRPGHPGSGRRQHL